MAQERTDLGNISDTDNKDYSRDRGSELSLADADGDQSEETDQIKERIEATRGQMGETIDAIQEKLSFSNISGQVSEHVNNAVETAKDAVYDATIGKAATLMKNLGDEITDSSIVRTAKDNPLPFVLIGLGAGLLAYRGFSGSENGGRRRRQLASATRGQIGDGNYKPGRDEKAGGTGVTTAISDVAGTAYEKVTSAVDTAVTGVSGAANQAYSKAGDVSAAARGQYEYYLEENPLAVGAVALALGAAVGMAIPATRYEGELLGQARQDLIDKAQNTASGMLEQTKEVVTEAGRNLAEQAKSAMAE